MNFRHLKQRLISETKANPKKAVMLGLLLLVGCYFWLPLAKKLIPTADSARKPPAPSASSNTAAGSSKPSAPPRASWQELSAWMEEHPWSQPAEPKLAISHPPFQSHGLKRKEVEKQEEEQAPVVATAPIASKSPAELGLSLSSTVTGGKVRCALVNGRVYREGATIESGGASFKLVRVEARRVVLERDGERFELAIPEAFSITRVPSTQEK